MNIFLCINLPKDVTNGRKFEIHPPIEEPEDITDFRPISLINTDYKILSSVLSNRLHLILPNIVASHQNAYVKGRLIFNNILNTKTVMELAKIGYILFLDFNKAFDSTDRIYLIKVLKKFNLGDKFINLIEQMHSNTTSCILNNGFISEKFITTSGVKQGDPISGLLFILCLEPLLNRIKKSPDFKGISIQEIIFYLNAFADDTNYMCKDESDIDYVLKIHDLFAEISNLRLNLKKSFIYSIKKTNQNEISNVRIVKKEPEKYLGFLFNEKGIVNNLNSKIDKVEQKLITWKKSFLSLNGKICVLKTYTLSMFLYYTYVLSLNVNQDKYIWNLISWFLWSKDNIFDKNKHYRMLVSKKRLLMSKKNGGLELFDNFKRTDAQRIQMMIFSERSDAPDWRKLINQKLQQYQDLEYDRNSIPNVYGLWGDNLNLDKNLHDSIYLNFINFAFDTVPKDEEWFYTCYEFSAFIHFWDEKIYLFTDFTIDNGTVIINNKYEEVEKFEGTLYPIEEPKEIHNNQKLFLMMPDRIEETDSYKFHSYNTIDNVSFINCKLKHIYKKLVEEEVILTKKQQLWIEKYNLNFELIWKLILKLNTRSKIKELIWKIYSNSLYIGNNLKYFAPEQENCTFCGQKETMEHLFQECNFTKKIIRRFFKYWYNWNYEKINNSSFFNFNLNTSKLCLLIYNDFKSICFWSIWKLRNESIFNQKLFSLDYFENIFEKEIQRYVNCHADSVNFKITLMKLGILEWDTELKEKTSLPDQKSGLNKVVDEINYKIIYTDGGCRNNGKPNAISSYGIFFSKDNIMNEGGLMKKKPHTNNRGELYAIIRTFQIYHRKRRKKNIYFITDSKYVIKLFKNLKFKWKSFTEDDFKKNNKKNYDLIIRLKRCLEKYPKTKIQHVFGHTGNDGNEGADALCNLAMDNMIQGFDDDFPKNTEFNLFQR